MKMPPFTYHRPDTVDTAVALLAEYGDSAKVLAGGQSLLPVMAMRLGQPEHLVDIGHLSELRTIREHDGGVAIGALTTHAEAERSELVATAAPLVAAAMPHIGHRPIRTRGTVCGSLAHADPAAELPAVALATGAQMVIRGVDGERVVEADQFFLSYLTTALTETELLTEVRFPAWPGGAGASVQELSRRHGDYALVGVAAGLHAGNGTIDHATLAFFGAGPTAVKVREAEAVLVGVALEPDAFAAAAAVVKERLDPPADIHASSAYRRHIAGVLTQRALTEAASQIGANR